ncbi:hypothetical protein VP01_1664g3 [Puccinia sorghi]|uniref:Retrovirus-related Pol polyprotein from transposon TNT 1-94-like beta-barrel domain-containing protein n=1 Tax=Puccinia sorghi TaxID=27349 RepID=A0A0L6VGA9_9BASI|nr:hypothetical protein VP01_1664g3 [Puccinia sorghi]
MYTKEGCCCSPRKYNPLDAHSKEIELLHQELNVSCFSTFPLNHSSAFFLDSGCTSHMVSDLAAFSNLEKTKGGLINTSSKPNALTIEGRGSIIFSYNRPPLILHDFLLIRVTEDNETLFEGNYFHDLPVIPFMSTHQLSNLSNLTQANSKSSLLYNPVAVRLLYAPILISCCCPMGFDGSGRHKTCQSGLYLGEADATVVLTWTLCIPGVSNGPNGKYPLLQNPTKLLQGDTTLVIENFPTIPSIIKYSIYPISLSQPSWIW